MARILLTVTSTEVSLCDGGGGHQEAGVAGGESVGAEDVGHAVHGGEEVSPLTRGLMVTITGISRPPGTDMSPDDVAHARSHKSLVTSLVCAPLLQG